VFVCSLSYPEYNARAPYYIVRFYSIFPHYLTNGTIFEMKVTEHKMRALILSTVLSETFRIIRRTQRDIVVNVRRSLCEVPVIFVRF
jgi:hypothetical protein